MLSRLLAPPLCWSCGALARADEPLCLSCRRALRRLAPAPVVLAGVAVWAPVAYEGAARALVRALKFKGATGIADTMAALIAAGAPPGALIAAGARPAAGAPGEGLVAAAPVATVAGSAAATAVGAPAPVSDRRGRGPPGLVPVPLHSRRLRRRGFNQATLLAQALAGRTGLPVADCLARAGSVGSQVGRPRAARLAAPPGRIGVRSAVPARAVLVDDVATTGATLAACAAALRAAGCREIEAVTFTRTPGR